MKIELKRVKKEEKKTIIVTFVLSIYFSLNLVLLLSNLQSLCNFIIVNKIEFLSEKADKKVANIVSESITW